MIKTLATSLLALSTVLSLAACDSQDYGPAPTLDDDTTTEQVVETPNNTTPDVTEDQTQLDELATNDILRKYPHVDQQKVINQTALAEALTYFDKNQSIIKNKKYVSVIDFSLRSTRARFFIIDMNTGKVWAIHTAHGKGSDSNHDGYAEKFSNVSGSNASSLGFYLTAETYYGNHGLSLRLDGKSSTNSRARSRAVVIHGASYVQEASVIQGRSWGCPAVANNLKDQVIGMLKGGSLIYAVAK